MVRTTNRKARNVKRSTCMTPTMAMPYGQTQTPQMYAGVTEATLINWRKSCYKMHNI